MISVYSVLFIDLSLCVRTSRHDLSISFCSFFLFPTFSQSLRLFLFMPVQIYEGTSSGLWSILFLAILTLFYTALCFWVFLFYFFLPYSCNLYKHLIMAILFVPPKCHGILSLSPNGNHGSIFSFLFSFHLGNGQP